MIRKWLEFVKTLIENGKVDLQTVYKRCVWSKVNENETKKQTRRGCGRGSHKERGSQTERESMRKRERKRKDPPVSNDLDRAVKCGAVG